MSESSGAGRCSKIRVYELKVTKPLVLVSVGGGQLMAIVVPVRRVLEQRTLFHLRLCWLRCRSIEVNELLVSYRKYNIVGKGGSQVCGSGVVNNGAFSLIVFGSAFPLQFSSATRC